MMQEDQTKRAQRIGLRPIAALKMRRAAWRDVCFV